MRKANLFHRISLALSVTALTALIVASNPTGSLAQNNDPCTPNPNTFTQGIDFNDCPFGTTAPTFNAFRNFPMQDGTKNDERDFLKVVKFGERELLNNTTVKPGDKLRFIAYLHNDCNPNDNDGGLGPCVAENVKTFVRSFEKDGLDFFTDFDNRHTVEQTFRATNTTPNAVKDSAVLRSADGSKVRLKYIRRSAKFANGENQSEQFPLLANALFGRGAELTSVNTESENSERGQVFGSNLFILYVFFDVIVEEEPEVPGQDECEKLDILFPQGKSDGEADGVLFNIQTTPPQFRNDAEIQITAGSGEIFPVAGRGFVGAANTTGTIVTASVPGAPQCTDSFTINLDDTPEGDECISVKLNRNTFNPNEFANKFTVTTNPANFKDLVWSLNSGSNARVEIARNNRSATFFDLDSDDVVTVRSTNNEAGCRDQAKAELVCEYISLKPRLFPANGQPQPFELEVFPPQFESDFIWSTDSPTGLFADGNQVDDRIRTRSKRVIYSGGQPFTKIDVRAANPEAAKTCKIEAFASYSVTPPPSDKLVKVASTNIAEPGDIIKYTVQYTYDSKLQTQPSIRIFDTAGVEGKIKSSRANGGQITPLPNSMRVNLPACRTNTDRNCYTGSILKPEGIELQNLTPAVPPVTISYEGRVDSVIDASFCQNLTGGFCGEQFLNEAFSNAGHRANQIVTILCPAFRSFGFGDLLLEQDFKQGIDTLSCGQRPNTEGIIIKPETPITPEEKIVSTGGRGIIDGPRASHAECRKPEANGVFSNISSALCELESQVSDRLKNPLDNVARNVKLICNNAPSQNEVILRSGTTSELSQYANPNNKNELVICANTITTTGDIVLEHDGPVTLVAENSINFKGDITYSRDANITPLLVAVTKGTANITNANTFSGFLVVLPDTLGKFAAVTIKPATSAAFNVIGAMIGTNFELSENDFNLRYDGGRLLLTEPSVLNDALEFIQSLTAN